MSSPFDALFAEDAILFSPSGPPASRRTAIANTRKVWFDDGASRKMWDVIRAKSDGSTGRAVGISLNALQNHPDTGWRPLYISQNLVPATDDAP